MKNSQLKKLVKSYVVFLHGGDSKFFTCVGLSKVSLRSSDPRTPSESNLSRNDVQIDSLEKLHEDRAKIRMKGLSQL